MIVAEKVLLLLVISLTTYDSIKTHLLLYASVNWLSIGSDDGLSPFRRQAIVLTNAGLIRPLGTNYK